MLRAHHNSIILNTMTELLRHFFMSHARWILGAHEIPVEVGSVVTCPFYNPPAGQHQQPPGQPYRCIVNARQSKREEEKCLR